jgi:predicted DNA-binding antitoxin AbrB/MazE fold protein
MEIIEAEFENGVLRPVRRLTLRPGERVGIVVVRRPDPSRWDLDRLSRSGAADDEQLAEQGLGDWAGALDREDRRLNGARSGGPISARTVRASRPAAVPS